MASKSDFANFVNKADLDDKLKKLNKQVTLDKTKHVLLENKLKELTKKFNYYQQKVIVFIR